MSAKPSSAADLSLQPFRLSDCPRPPTTRQWRDILRWLVAVMDDDDKALGFVASMLNHAIERDGLTPKQVIHAERLWMAYEARYRLGELESQTR